MQVTIIEVNQHPSQTNARTYTADSITEALEGHLICSLSVDRQVAKKQASTLIGQCRTLDYNVKMIRYDDRWFLIVG